MKKIVYIFASCKSWHRNSFEIIKNNSNDKWLWVETAEELVAVASEHSPRYIFFLHWNWHVPKQIWSKIECVSFHMTDLPFGRGGSPLQNLIIRGITETQISAIQLIDEIDAGPVYIKKIFSLEGRAEDIYIRAGSICVDIIKWLIETNPEAIPQTGEPVYFDRRQPEQSLFPSIGDISHIYDHIRMLDAPGYPLSFIEHGNLKLEFSHATLGDNEIQATVVIRKK
jgi:methionyl-tRNA formyltransferase